VAHEGGFALTRAGDFVVDATGTLTTQAGEPVLAVDGQPIVLPAGAGGFTVGPDGTVQETGQRLAVVGWPAAGVVRLGGNLLTSADGTPLTF
jgi:flagellar basal body rod protein FlgG